MKIAGFPAVLPIVKVRDGRTRPTRKTRRTRRTR
jgi:hypothetical protein